eukprot:COSAG01_NODE_2329_length_7892_cov_2.592711_1_plen_169_part_00
MQDELRQVAATMHTAEGRARLAAAASSSPGAVCALEADMFDGLVLLLEACFASVLEQKDFTHLQDFVTVIDKYARGDAAGAEGSEPQLLADDERIRACALWTDTAFWTEVVVSETANSVEAATDEEGVPGLTAKEHQNSLAILWVSRAATKMLEFGDVAAHEVDKFVK